MVIVFDLDGTILDTYELIKTTFLEVFKNYYPKHIPSEEDLKRYFGPTLIETFTNVTGDGELAKYLTERYKVINKELQPKLIKIYPGVLELLEELRKKGYKLAVFSNKTKSVIVSGLMEVNALESFDYILGYDEVTNPKPSREGLDRIREEFNDEVLYVGDSEGDMATAKNANCLAIGVSQAVISREALINAGADYVIDRIYELLELLEEIHVWHLNNW